MQCTGIQTIMDLVTLEQLINRYKDEFDEYLKNAKRGNAYCEAKEKCCASKSATVCRTLTNAKSQSGKFHFLTYKNAR